MTGRIDEIDKYYTPVGHCETVAGILFWICAVFSLASPYASKILPNEYLYYVNGLFIVFVVFQSAVSIVNSGYYLPTAEKKRRQHLLSNSFGVHLSFDRTHGYYNNYLSPGMARLGANVLENTFFSKTIYSEMLKRARLTSSMYVLLWLLMLIDRHTDLSFIMIATQVVFSGEVIIKWIKLEILCLRTEHIHDDLCTHYRNRISNTDNMGVTEILESFSAFETAKSAAAIPTSTKIFRRLNTELTEKWTQLRKDLRIDEEDSEEN